VDQVSDPNLVIRAWFAGDDSLWPATASIG